MLKRAKVDPLHEEALEARMSATSKATFIPLMKEICIFLVGVLGLIVLEYFFSYILYFAGVSDKTTYTAGTTFISYLALFLILIAIIFPSLSKLAERFKGWKPYAAGAVCGIALILFSLAYTNIINLFYKIGDSENQQIAVQYIKAFPVASIAILGFIGPICEEITYRLGLFSALKRWNNIAAYIISPVIFALIHFGFTSINLVNEFINVPIYLFSGFAITYTYDKFGFGASTVGHVINNLYSIVVILITGK